MAWKWHISNYFSMQWYIETSCVDGIDNEKTAHIKPNKLTRYIFKNYYPASWIIFTF
jgi:hypothetical protein